MAHFGGQYVHQMVHDHQARLQADLLEMGEELLLRPEEDVISELVNTYRLAVPQLRRDQMYLYERKEVTEAGARRVQRLVFAIPFEGQPGLFGVQPSSLLITRYDGIVRGDGLLLTVIDRDGSVESVQRDRDKQLSAYESSLSTLRQDVRAFNGTLPGVVRQMVETRRAKLLRDRNLVARLDVPLRKREDATVPVVVQRRLRIPPSPQPGETFRPEPALRDEEYAEVLKTIRSMGVVMERAPGTFDDLSEEGIRDFFLAQLNGMFHGGAVAEAFNAGGKTDILIRSGERNVFIAEFKVWSGPQAFVRAIDQLLNNLGWRDTKCAMILLVRQRDVSAVVDKANAVLREHPCSKRYVAGEELEHRYVFHWPGDERRELTLTVSAFAIPEAMARRSRRRKPPIRDGK